MGTTQAVNIISFLEYSRTDVPSQSATRAGGEVLGTRKEMPPFPFHLEGSWIRYKRTIPARLYYLSYYCPQRSAPEGCTLVAAGTS